MRAAALPILIACLLSVGQARAENFVTVRAWADSAYAARKAGNGTPIDESYIVAKGEYFSGACRDPSIEKASFRTIVELLAKSLTRQHYYPTKDVAHADQIIVVHWGMTIPYVSDYEQRAVQDPTAYDPHPGDFATPGMTASMQSDPGGAATLASMQGTMRDNYIDQQEAGVNLGMDIDQMAHTLSSYSAAGLLGYTAPLRREGEKMMPTELERTLLANLHEDRYFIIIQAWDFHKLLKEHKRKLLWTARMSMRAPGMNFALALPRMGRIASDYYGKSNNDVITAEFQPAKEGRVELGPIRILGEVASADVRK